jgi:transitional endoplasmic reticulum ATPase
MSDVVLPAWAALLRARYLAGEASLFLVHGNVRDLHPWVADGKPVEWVDLRTFLERFLARTRDIVAYYNVSQGLCFREKVHEKLFFSSVDARRMLRGEPKLGALPQGPASAIPVIEDLIQEPTHSSAVIVDFFEMIAPNGDVAFLSAEDRANLVSVQRWASDPAFQQTDNLVVLVAEHLSDVSRRVVSSPQLAAIQVPFPTIDDRRQFLASQDTSDVKLELDVEALAKVTAGLSRTQIRNILRGAAQSGEAVNFRSVSLRKKSIIEQECHGLVEFVTPDHDFSHVGGMERVKADLLRVAKAVRDGRTSSVPMGMIFVGPMGTGKTFVAEAFAAESGLTCLQFKNFREKWVGSTEANLEKILDLVEALGYVLLIIDEADRSLSAGESDGGTSSRVIARLKEFMSDTDHRGRVVILMMTNRPDKLDVDLKRPGRFDLKIPFFFPEEPEERERVLRAVLKRHRIAASELNFTGAVAGTAGYSAAEIEAVVLAAQNRAHEQDRDVVGQEDLDGAVADVIPSRDTRMLEYMELLAVFEASARRMLPDRYKDVGTDEVQQRLDALRGVLGRRAI